MTSAVRLCSAAVEAMQESWQVIEALSGGTAGMRKQGKRYLPQWPAEDTDSYKERLATATVFSAFTRTISVLTGKPFSKSITLRDDVPARLQELMDDVDRQGRNLTAFAADVCQEGLSYGLCGILVDCPPAKGARTVSDEKSAGIRPYLIHVRHGSILGWRTEDQAGRKVLTQLRLLETKEIPDGDFATKTIEQVRVLEPGTWQTWRKLKDDDPDSWAPFEAGATSITDIIPFVPVYGLRRDFMIGDPPLLELAYANIEHWQSKSDQQTILHVARVPVLFGKNIGEAPITVGAGALIKASGNDCDLKYVEHGGAAIEAGRKSLLDLEDRMRQIGAELLVKKPGNISEIQTLADNEPGMCDLQRMVQVLENALDQSLALMARFTGEAEGGHVSIYNDFGASTLAEASAELLLKMKEGGVLTGKTLLLEAQRRGILSPDVDPDDEVKLAKAEVPPPEVQVQDRV